MASVIAQQEHAREMLDVSLGKKRVLFNDLSPTDADEFLRETLADVDLRELRGFKPLKNLLTFRPGSVLYGAGKPCTLEVEVLDLSPNVSLIVSEDSGIDLDTHFIMLCRGLINLSVVFKRHETDEETSDWHKAHSWGRSAYHYKGNSAVIALRRPRNHTRADENLVVIKFWYEKVPLENRHIITNFEVVTISIENLRERLGRSYARIAVELVWELRDAYRRTAAELESQANLIRHKVVEFERRGSAVYYHIPIPNAAGDPPSGPAE